MSEFHLLEIPEDPPRLGQSLHRRVSALLVDSTKCLRDPRALTKDNAASQELDFLVSEGLVRILDQSVIEEAAAAQVASSRSFVPSPDSLERFCELLTRLGGIQIQGSNKIFMPGHTFVGDPAWFPAKKFTFQRPFSPDRIRDAAQHGGAEQVVRLMAEAMYERTAAELATLQAIGQGEGADLVSSELCAPTFRAVEESALGDAPPPNYISAGADILATAILRHARAIENLESLSIEEVVKLARRLAGPRRGFQDLLRKYSDEVIASADPPRDAIRIFRKHVEPEIAAYDAKFGSVFRTLKAYTVDALRSPTALSVVPLAALGLVAGWNTAWTLTVAGGYSAWKTAKDARAWPRLLFELQRA